MKDVNGKSWQTVTHYLGEAVEIHLAPSPLGGEGGGEGSNTVLLHIYAGGQKVASKTLGPPSHLIYYHADHLGSDHLITEGKAKGKHAGITYLKGQVIQRFEYAAFGRESFALNPNLAWDPAYTGQKYDIETGLYYYRARYYNPILGRFIQPDTIVQNPFDPQSWNRYSYVRNNPLKYTDPTGNKVEYDPATDTFDYSADKPTFGVADEFREYAGGVRERTHNLIANEGGLVGAAVVTATLAIHVMTGGYSEQVIKAGRTVIQAGSWLLEQARSWVPQVQMSAEEEYIMSSVMGMVGGGIRVVGGAGKISTGRVFWSGSESAKNAAINFAKTNNLTTLEMTKTGKELISKTKGMPWSEAGPIWRALSKEFAKGAEGPVHVFHSGQGVNLNSIWRTIEYPILRSKKNVEIIYHTTFE